MKDLTSNFSIQPNGSFSCSIPGFKGVLKVEFSPSATRAWVKVISLMPGAKAPQSSVYQGKKVAIRMFYPSMATVTLVCDEKPSSASLVEFDGAGSGSSPEIVEKVNEQEVVNNTQQQQIDQNIELDDKQQQQIDSNAQEIESIKQGIGEEAARDLVDKIFGHR